MKRWLIILFLLITSPAWPSDFCFDFRATGPFVTDPSPCVPVLGETYPNLYSNGITAGFVTPTAIQTRDRSTGVDARVAGVIFDGTTNLTFRIDLDAAESKTVRVALGDQGSGHANVAFDLKDSTTIFKSVGPSTLSANQYIDASGVTRSSDSDWATNNVAFTRVFGSTIFNTVGTCASSSECTVAHIRVTTTPGGAVTPSRTLTGVGS